MGKTLILGAFREAIDGGTGALYKRAIPRGREGGPSAERHAVIRF